MKRDTASDDARYAALLARDPRFDGKFFVGVRTTGIYCRPICPAKPKRKNVDFFRNRLEAERAGYRPCLRCRPESAPASPAWFGKSAIVRRAVKTLGENESLAFDESAFAARFGVTARHLRRLFIEEVGKTPKQISVENRLNLARKLIVETTLPLAEVAFAAGFRSVRRFNDAFLDRFKRNPNALRPGRPGPRSKARRAREEDSMIVTLPYRPPFHFESLYRAYEMHRVGRLEWFTENTMHRVVSFGGRVGVIAISDEPTKSRLRVAIDFPDASAIHAILGRVRTLFDLDSDPLVIANSLESDPKTKALLAKHPGIRLASGWDPFEIGIGVILGQLVSVAWARTLVGDLVESIGKESGLVVPEGLPEAGRAIKLFPTPAEVAAADLTSLRCTTARKRAIAAFARAVSEGTLSLEPTQEVERFVKTIRTIPGIGPWTANIMALRVLRHTDAFPSTDLILARALELHPPEAVERMSPWRGYAAALYWREYAGTLKKKKSAPRAGAKEKKK